MVGDSKRGFWALFFFILVHSWVTLRRVILPFRGSGVLWAQVEGLSVVVSHPCPCMSMRTPLYMVVTVQGPQYISSVLGLSQT